MSAREGERILVVDDAPTIRQLLRLVLESAGYDVDALGSADEAIAALRDNRYALVIVDKNLDGDDGFEVCHAARDMCPDAARLLVTADQSVESAIRAVEEDIFAYMTKPLRKQEVLLKVRRALDRVHLTREREEARAEMQAAKEALERRTAELERTLDQLLKAQTRLAESEKLVSLGMLAAGVAHEINNPACFILPNLEYLKRSAQSLGDTARTAGAAPGDVEREVQHINRMLDRCLEGVGRIQKVVGTLQLFSRRDLAEPEPVDLHALCVGLVDLVNHELIGRARLDVDLKPIPPVMGRPKEVAQAILNLLLNARRAVLAASERRDHEISLHSFLADNEVVLEVRDTGAPLSPPGSSTSEVDTFFMDQHCADPESPGLTLRLARDIVDRYGGRLCISSSTEGNLLRVFFPAPAPD